ncbi:50S ribosomal protein L23 [mine drainage metagenome]|uniref:50S ribosomal protein L23 n=1 Tax=mine drainage metagenome TaxID=410659 RepID=T1BWB2_9ZZZZ
MSTHAPVLHDLILGPHLTEKATRLASEHKQYVFRVRDEADKSSIQKAVEALFQVKVARVTLARMPGKTKRHGSRIGRRSGFKKAYVVLTPGQSLDFGGGTE